MTILNIDWDGLCKHLRDDSWEDIFWLRASATASEIDICIPRCKYRVKPHSSSWFSATCAAAIVIEITFFVCTNRINLNLKESSDRLAFVPKGFLKLPNMHMLIKQKSLIISQKLGPWEFWQNANSVLNLLCLLCSTIRRCPELLHLIKQNCLLNTFLKTLILMTQASL